MRKSYIAIITLAGLFSTQAFAECDSKMPYEQLVDCIVTEGSGAKYPQKSEESLFDYSESKKNPSETSKHPARPAKALATNN